MKTLSDFLVNLVLLAVLVLIGFIFVQKYQTYKSQLVAESVEKSQVLSQQSELKSKIELLQKENDSLKDQIQKEKLAAIQLQKQTPDYTEKLNQLSNQVLELSNRKFVVEVPPTKDSTTPFLLTRIKSLESENKSLLESMNTKEKYLVNKNIEEVNSYKSKIEYYVKLDEYNKSKISQLEKQALAVKPVVRCDPPRPVLSNAVQEKDQKHSFVNSSKKMSKSDKKSKQVDQLN